MKCQENWWVCLKDRGRVTDHIISYAILWGKVNSLEKASSCLQIWLRIQLVVLLVTRIGFCKYTDKSSKMHKGNEKDLLVVNSYNSVMLVLLLTSSFGWYPSVPKRVKGESLLLHYLNETETDDEEIAIMVITYAFLLSEPKMMSFSLLADWTLPILAGFLYVQSFVVFYCVAVPEEVGTCCHLQLWMVHPMSKSFHGRNLLLVLIDTIDCWAYLIFLVTLVEELIFLLMLGSFHTPGPAMHYDVGAGRLWSSLNASITPLPHLLGVNMKKMLID